MRRAIVALVLLPLVPLAAQTFKPGQWELVSTVTNVVMPDAPPAVIAAMKARPQTLRHCLTAEQAAKGPREMMKAAPSCKVTRFVDMGGRIDAAMSCADPRGGTMQVSSKGNYTPVSYSVVSHSVIGRRDGKAMVIDGRSAGRWTGTCGK